MKQITYFLDEVFQGREKSPSLLRWIIHSWHSWGWDSGFLTLNSVIFSLHQTPCPCDYDPEGRKHMKVEAKSLLPFISDSLLFGSLGISMVTAMWKWTSKMYGFLTCENIIFGIPSSFSQATVGPQFLEWWVILWLLVIPSHKSCKWDHETHLVSISSYVTSLSLHHKSQEVFQSKNPHFHLGAFLTLKQKISSFCIIFNCTFTPLPMLRLFLETHRGTSETLFNRFLESKSVFQVAFLIHNHRVSASTLKPHTIRMP